MDQGPGLGGRVVWQDDDLLVLNKIPGESAETPESPSGSLTGLPRLLEQEFGTPFFPVHRLDAPVSGCVLFARNRRALAFLSECFRTPGRVEKIYWAVTEVPRKPGIPLPPGPPGYTEFVHWLERGPGNRSVAFDDDRPGRKKSVLRCRTLGRGDHYLFLELSLITGRHHQIRAQLSRAGLPVKGDLKYGARRSEKGGGIRLHAYSLAFPSPRKGLIRVECPPPLLDNLWRAFLDTAPGPAP
jgi:23S rRNA pseudouridine1911/1915/1917 synthase